MTSPSHPRATGLDVACDQEWDLFDDPDADAELVAAICGSCQAYRACQQWAEAQPANRRHGWLAGEWYEWQHHPSRHPKKPAA